MQLARPEAVILVPDGAPLEAACARVTHLGIGAHHDDLEIMAYHGIETCRQTPGLFFGGVTCTDGRGSARSGAYAGYDDEAMMAVRIAEQNKAAALGEYSVMLQLGHASAEVKKPDYDVLTNDLETILKATRPRVIYTHNPADKHDTHIGVFASALRAIRRLPVPDRPEQLLGCEVWRGLDWMPDEDKVVLPLGDDEAAFKALVGMFDSQIAGGKRYDLAAAGRARANATFFASHNIDASPMAWFAMDLSPLVQDDQLDPVTLVEQHLQRFTDDVRGRLSRITGR